jgi:hypothetical protein
MRRNNHVDVGLALLPDPTAAGTPIEAVLGTLTLYWPTARPLERGGLYFLLDERFVLGLIGMMYGAAGLVAAGDLTDPLLLHEVASVRLVGMLAGHNDALLSPAARWRARARVMRRLVFVLLDRRRRLLFELRWLGGERLPVRHLWLGGERRLRDLASARRDKALVEFLDRGALLVAGTMLPSWDRHVVAVVGTHHRRDHIGHLCRLSHVRASDVRLALDHVRLVGGTLRRWINRRIDGWVDRGAALSFWHHDVLVGSGGLSAW